MIQTTDVDARTEIIVRSERLISAGMRLMNSGNLSRSLANAGSNFRKSHAILLTGRRTLVQNEKNRDKHQKMKVKNPA